MGIELDAYKVRTDQTIIRLQALKDITSRIGLLVSAAQFGVAKYKTADKTAEKIDDSLFTIKNLLTVAGFVSPLKTPVTALQRVLDRIEPPVDKIDDKFDEISGKDDTSTPATEGDGQFVENVETGLTAAGLTLAVVSDSLTLRIRQLEIASEATGSFRQAIDVATRSAEVWSGTYTALNSAIEAQMAARNAVIVGVESLYTNVKAEVDAFLAVLEDIDFGQILGGLVDLEEIGKIFDFLKTPLSAAESLLAPIQPLLNAVDFLIGLIVNPVIDFVIETLNLDNILEATEAAIDALIPSINLLDAFEQLIQPLQDFLLEYIVDALGTIPLLDTVESAFFGGVVGEADLGPTGWGNDVGNVLVGDDGDDILDALDGNDTILGGGGNDVIIAGAGSDLLNGGAGDDLFYFGASFTEYELLRDPDTGDIIVSHLAPQTAVNTGIDTLVALDDGDHVVFTDISFTGAELNNARIGGSVLNGDQGGVPTDDLLFLNSSRPENRINGFHVANGLLGDDRIFGSIEADQLNGGPGDDVLVPGRGDDQANGGTGTDTFQVLRGANSRLRVDLINGTSFGQGQDTLSSVENVVASPDQDHTVRGTDGANAIYTGDGVDIITGRAGNDTIDAGGDDDYIIGGAGADVINAGAGGIDVMVSGSAAVAGISDHYIGGDGFDWVSYTSSANTIRFDISDQGDDPNHMQVFNAFMGEVENSGAVRINGADRTITRFDLNGNEVTTDTTDGVEGFMGSDLADVLLGAPDVTSLHGAGGDDTIRTGGSTNIFGGTGDDLIYVEEVEGGSTALQVDGGGGSDTISLDDVSDARWFFNVNTAIALTLRAHKTTVEGEDLRNAGDVFFNVKPRDFSELSFGNFADHVIFEPGGSFPVVFRMLDGNDRFDAENGFADVHAGNGNDIGNFDGGGGGIFRGDAGDDYAVFNDAGTDNAALMGADTDFVQIERFRGHADGSTGYDTISFDVAFSSRIVVDLAAGTVTSFKGVPSSNADQVNMTLENFEVLIATEFNDLIDGSAQSEQILGRGGNDTLRGAGGNDKLFGGTGNDTLEGGGGDDLLHGGAGDDRLDGGAESDTASYAWARPGGIDGAIFANTFGSVSVSLSTGTAMGVFGTDTLISIENVIGTGANDILLGNELDNMLSGGAGNDNLEGLGGDDVLITGSGDDTVSAGAGDDTVVVGLGNKNLNGGSGFDTLDFGTVSGAISLNLGTGTYTGSLIDRSPRWADLDPDGDGIAESDGTEARIFNSVALTPLDVFEANPIQSNSADDLSRVLPTLGDHEFSAFQIALVDIETSAFGSFIDFERVIGGDSDDAFTGTGAANQLSGGAGQDNLTGLAGNDELSGGLGNDTLNGGADDDTLDGGAGNDSLLGGAGFDLAIFAVASTEVNISQADGPLTLFSSEGDDTVDGIESFRFTDATLTLAQVLALPPVGQQVTGTAGNDTINGDAGDDTLIGQGGNDSILGLGGDDGVFGEAGNDTLSGGDGNDSIAGADGDDVVNGGAGNDNIGGGFGNDTINGGDGDDIMGAGFGDDSVVGAAGNDVVAGGAGNDTLSGGSGDDSMSGSFGNDLINAGGGADDIGGGAGQDTIDAGAGNDRVGAGEGDDSVFGGDGNDFLAGGGRNDTIDGGAGNDTINAGAGNDVITGGTGADQFVFASFFEGEADVVTDFEDGIDSFFIRRFDPDTGIENITNGGNGLAGFVAAMNIIDTAAGAQMTVNGNTILVEGITAAQLTVDDFQFL
uniref:calcium-binding protein n=1 Tax=Roseovarius sp. BRH_c41 TaxID=1629709 RepID=UPI000A62ADC7|nr:calcium-binding protein [Roseovarius sp. BRH_c41]